MSLALIPVVFLNIAFGASVVSMSLSLGNTYRVLGDSAGFWLGFLGFISVLVVGGGVFAALFMADGTVETINWVACIVCLLISLCYIYIARGVLQNAKMRLENSRGRSSSTVTNGSAKTVAEASPDSDTLLTSPALASLSVWLGAANALLLLRCLCGLAVNFLRSERMLFRSFAYVSLASATVDSMCAVAALRFAASAAVSLIAQRQRPTFTRKPSGQKGMRKRQNSVSVNSWVG